MMVDGFLKILKFLLITNHLCLVNCDNCPFDSCDIFRFLSHFKSESNKIDRNEITEKIQTFVSMERKMNDIDRRLRSVEQPCMLIY